jgi:hypothetical protein
LCLLAAVDVVQWIVSDQVADGFFDAVDSDSDIFQTCGI